LFCFLQDIFLCGKFWWNYFFSVESKSGFLFCFVKSQRLYQAQSAPQVFFIHLMPRLFHHISAFLFFSPRKKNIFKKKMWCFFFWTRLFVFRICFYLWDIYGYEKFTHHLYKNAALETDLIARLEFFDNERILHRSKRKKNTRKWQLFYINHLFSHPKKGGGDGGMVYLGKKIRAKSLTGKHTRARLIFN